MNDREPTSSPTGDDTPGADPPSPHSIYRRAFDWVDRHPVDVSGRAPHQHQHGLLSTSLAIFLRVHFQTLREISEQDRISWGGYLKTFQRSDTGFFVDPALRVPKSAGGHGSADDDDPLTRLVTCYVLQALKVLDMPAASELHFMEALADQRAVEAWLETSDWSNAALQSERMMCVLLFLLHQAEAEHKPHARALYHRILDWCESVQDPKTGLIGVTTDNFPLHALVATDRLLPFYAYVQRPVQRAAHIVDTILSLQEADDALARSRGSAREALAAINLLGLAGRQSTYRDAEVKEALVRSHASIVAMQREDGSFPDIRSAVPESDLFCHPALVAGHSAPDLLSHWIRVLTLTIIEHRYPDTFLAADRWRFHQWPGLGYHSSSKTLTDHERKVLPLWIRPTACSDEPDAGVVASPPAVSVVVPCYNLGRYLHEALESVLVQDLSDFEIIVVDDGSTDEYTRLLLEHLERPKTTIIRQSNQGVATARNNGIRAGTGRYICCLDPDDRLRPGFFAKAVAILDSRDDVGLVSGSVAEFDEREQVIRRDACALGHLLTYNPIIEPAMFRRKAWEETGGYYRGFSSSGVEDWDLWLGILERGYRTEVIPDIVWDYRIHADQMSTGMNEPGTWGQLMRELVSRHAAAYHEHMPDVVGKLAVQFAEIRDWAAECRGAAGWWERQSGNWQRQAQALAELAARGDQTALSRQARIAELERELTTRDDAVVSQRARITELERELTARDQAVLTQQARIEESERELTTKDQTLVTQQARIAELERQLTTLEARRLKHRISRWLAKLGRSPHDRSE